MKPVADLEGAELDYYVAKAEGLDVHLYRSESGEPSYVREPTLLGKWFNFSTDWAQGGPIIEREQLDIEHLPGENSQHKWRATWWGPDQLIVIDYGPTILIAAMRAYVAAYFGESVEGE